MFQPQVKLEFVRRYCLPANGWQVHVDLDASEFGRTGGRRKNEESAAQRLRMQLEGERARDELIGLGAVVGGARRGWFERHGCPLIPGDRDLIAISPVPRRIVVAELEGESSAQPEQKLYRALGQLVVAASLPVPDGWERTLILVVYGKSIGEHLERAGAIAGLGVLGVVLADNPTADRWLWGRPPSLQS